MIAVLVSGEFCNQWIIDFLPLEEQMWLIEASSVVYVK
jgi:hypothetical protein